MLSAAARTSLRGALPALCLLLPGPPAAPAAEPVQLVIAGASLFDPASLTVRPGRTVVVDKGRILDVLGPEVAPPESLTQIEAEGRLLAPGLLDVHTHTSSVLGDSVGPGGGEVCNLAMEPDSIAAYRRRFAETVLPYGVTGIREGGGDERWLAMMRAWMDPVPWAPDFYPSGGAIITRDTSRTAYVGHIEVEGEEEARAKVRFYRDQGFRHVKLYWRLRELEFAAVLDEARRRGMRPYAHVDFHVFSIGRALDLGLADFEHAYTLFEEVLAPEDLSRIWTEETTPLLDGDMRGAFFVNTLEKARSVGAYDPRITALVNRIAGAGGSVTPTLHVFAHPYGLAWFPHQPTGDFNDTREFSEEKLRRGREGFREMQDLVLRLHRAGVRLQLGTDTGDPGKSALSEMLLLHDAGLTMPEVLRIATVNGALALGIEDEAGSVAPGKRANLVLFDEDPIEDPRALLAGRTVIKDGVVYGSD